MTPPTQGVSPKVQPNTCLELALEGERLCKSGDFPAGVAFLEAAVQIGTDDGRVLSAIYSQLGNAYFYLADYEKALRFHELDLKIVKVQGDILGEAKASGNLGNTLKMLGRFEEAIQFCEAHLLISKRENDKIGEGRAYYNLGNVYHSQGKQLAKETRQEPGDYPLEIRVCLHKAVECYERNLDLMLRLSDRVAQGRAYGNLGNTHYLLGNFRKAITFHEQRLKFATEFRDRAAERRAYSNLGNCHVFLGEFDRAAEYYRRTLELAQQLNDRAVEAQACYSLGNIYTLIGDLNTALDFHRKHLGIAKELKDRIGERQAYLSLSNCHQGLGELEKALSFANQHLELTRETGDVDGESTAIQAVEEISARLGTPVKPPQKLRRRSMENMDLVKMTPESASSDEKKENRKSSLKKRIFGHKDDFRLEPGTSRPEVTLEEKDNFLEMLGEFQADRMEDQRCSIAISQSRKDSVGPRAGPPPASAKRSALRNRSVSMDTQGLNATASQASTRPRNSLNGVSGPAEIREDLLDLIEGMQSRRMDEQRTSLPSLPGLSNPGTNNNNNTSTANNNNSQVAPNRMQVAGEAFFENLARCQSTRLEGQRPRLPEHADNLSMGSVDSSGRLGAAGESSGEARSAPTVPDDDFLNLIMRVQGNRMEDQRTALQPIPNREEKTYVDSAGNSVTGSSRRGSRRSVKDGDDSEKSSKSGSTRNKMGIKGGLKQAFKGREDRKHSSKECDDDEDDINNENNDDDDEVEDDEEDASSREAGTRG
ncbi:G-protein-signaling modulator 2 [Galendromus occidentalis]|uniref:G-protein-signaling modulator 2 n=1 Tax=Galendromus occidentalis TaxID=34638 RepID=A0AAJ7L2L8_9ACAR|nr:G-protein-signaling modulator 2 [Galendromus occidentalis]